MSEAAAELSPKHWLPTEANPEVIQSYCEKLGLPLAAAGLAWSDVMGFDEELLAMVPQPISAALMLFPVSAASEAHRAEEEAARLAAPPAAAAAAPPPPFRLAQTIDNACGTIGVVHVAAARSTLCGGPLELAAGSFLDKYVRGAVLTGSSASEAAAALEASEELDEAHEAVAQEGQSNVVDDTHQHFCAFVRGRDGQLWELDGRKAAPIAHGPTTPATMLADTARIVRAFMARDPEELRFALVTLGPQPAEE